MYFDWLQYTDWKHTRIKDIVKLNKSSWIANYMTSDY